MNDTNTIAPVIDPLAGELVPAADPLASATTSTAVVVHPEFPLNIISRVTRPGTLISLTSLTAEDTAWIDARTKALVIDNETAVTQFGFAIQKRYADSLDQMLRSATVGQARMYDFIAQELALAVGIVKETAEKLKPTPTATEEVGFFRKMLRSAPVVGTHVVAAEVLIASRKSLLDLFDKLERRVAQCQREVIDREAGIDVLQASNMKLIKELRNEIIAGEQALVRMYHDYQELVKQLPKDPDPIAIADLSKVKNLIIAFEVALVSKCNAFVKAATLRTKQNQGITEAGQIVLSNLQLVMTDTIPDLKTSALQLVALNELRNANSLAETVKAQARKAEDQAQELLGTVLIEAKTQQGEALSDAERLKGLLDKMQGVQQKLLELEGVNAEKRQQAQEILRESGEAFLQAEKDAQNKFLELAGVRGV